MKKLLFVFSFVVLSLATIAQPVKDMAVIPIGVSLNSIMRLTVVSGGNIEFVVNSMQQYTGGIGNTPLYDTRFQIASSLNFNVSLTADAANLVGTSGTGTMPVDNIGYTVTSTATLNTTVVAGIQILSTTATLILQDDGSGNAGNTNQHDYTINWELATDGTTGNNVIGNNTTAATLLAQSIPADRYTCNVLLQLIAL